MSGLCIWGAGDARQCAHSCTHTSLHDEFRCWRRKLGAPPPPHSLLSSFDTKHFTKAGRGWQLPGPRGALPLLSTALGVQAMATLTWVLGPKRRSSCSRRKCSYTESCLSSSSVWILNIKIFSKGKKISTRKSLIHAPWMPGFYLRDTGMLVLPTSRLEPLGTHQLGQHTTTWGIPSISSSSFRVSLLFSSKDIILSTMWNDTGSSWSGDSFPLFL